MATNDLPASARLTPGSPHPPDRTLATIAQRLVDWFDASESYVVALSGGVDSAVVASAAVQSGARVSAVTAAGPALSTHDRRDAEMLAGRIGISHRWLEAGELSDAMYRKNDGRRCYFCKTRLYETMRQVFPSCVLVSGTNADDLSDYRPGLQAAEQHLVRAPLAELGIGKASVRQLARLWHLQVADKPASPCLASRIAYGVEVTEERLRRIDAAERFLRSLGLPDCRVRLHADEVARLEVPESWIGRLMETELRSQVHRELRELGFRFVALDLMPFRSGRLNSLLPVLDSSADAP